MDTQTEEFFKKMIRWLPRTEIEYQAMKDKYGKVLESVAIEDIFMPEIIKLLALDTETKILDDIFDYFETISKNRNEHLINIFSVTVLEILGNDRGILEVAKKYMDPINNTASN